VAQLVGTDSFAADIVPIDTEDGARISVLYEDRAGTLWAGTSFGLYKSAPNERKLRPFTGDTIEPNLTRRQVVALEEDSKGNLWVGTFRGGLSRLNLATGQIRHYAHRDNGPGQINSKSVTCIHVDKRDRLWVGTYSGGLNLFDVESEVFSAYTERDGLSGSKVNAILEDERGRLWISTNNGISRFEPETGAFKNFDSQDGLQSNEFTMGAALAEGNGYLCFGGINGFNRFHPSELVEDDRPPRVALTGFRKFEKTIPLSTVRSERADIELAHDDRFISFEFVGLSYDNPQKTQYAYRLEGFDETWVDSGTRRYAAYTNLGPGSYTFYVRAASGEGIWSEPSLGLTVFVRPPFYRTTWFYFLLGGLLASGLWLAHALRVRYKIRQSVTLERVRFAERDRIREQISADYHDELGHKLTKISIFSELIKRNLNGQHESVEPYIDKVTESVATLARATRDFIWTLNPHRDSLYELVLHLQEFGIGLFEETEISFHVEGLSPEMREVPLSVEWKRHLILMFQEALHNSLKHADCTNVTFSVAVSTDSPGPKLTISVRDDGQGLEELDPSPKTLPREGAGQGFANINRRAAALGGKVALISDSGTRVEFRGLLPSLASQHETEVSP
jgi:signal transduction histidine kinase/streptogramin lyase